MSVEPTSKFYHPCVKRVEVIFNGARRHGDVVEYDADAGWIDVHRRDRRGRPLTQNGEWAVMHLWGTVEPVWRENLPSPQPRRHRQAAITDHDAHMQRADEKRARKAAQLQAKWDRDHA